MVFNGTDAPQGYRWLGKCHNRRKEGLSDSSMTRARPDKNFIAWYEPTIGNSGSEPDFILYGNSLGLRVLEVKDWEMDQIGEVTPHAFKFWTGDKKEGVTRTDENMLLKTRASG